MTPTQRTLKKLKARGLICAVVEKYNIHARRSDGKRGVRQDLFGIIDILALDPARGVVGVQSTGSDFAGHHKKITQEKSKEAIAWLRTPGTHLELYGWRKIKRGGRMIWAPRIHVYTLEEFVDFDPLKF